MPLNMLGIIADDFTGASDIASFLVENGLSCVQMNGVPQGALSQSVDAVVISLKSRSNPAEEAVAQSLAALDWLKAQGTKQFYFKYCSTFDSSEKGNIGPVTDALLDALGADFTVISPALPVNGRTIFNGYLFVGEVPLNESGMRNHPITPMRDANLMRLMDAQAKGKTGLVEHGDVAQGAQRVKARFAELKSQGYRYAVVDAVDNQQLAILAEAVADLPLLTGGSGLGAYVAARLSGGKKASDAFVPKKAKTIILSGSCSLMTNQQVAAYQSKAAHFYLDAEKAISNPQYADELYASLIKHLDDALAPMVYATVPAERLAQIQEKYGVSHASHAIEQTFAALARRLRKEAAVENFIIAGGETSSIIVQSLELSGFQIGKQIAAGVPWLKDLNSNIYLALKSGNFGSEAFFTYAQGMFA